jgi:SAM-dependent methyltransferase
MNRIELLTGHSGKQQRVIEIGPWYQPLLPKKAGYDVTILDVYPAEILRRRALADPSLPTGCEKFIEDVDLVGSACDIAELVASAGIPADFDHIVASHAFEHLPDPIRFLQGCEKVLAPGGMLSMAIPDKRGCFDYFRPVSSLAELLAAYLEKRKKPTLAQVFERWSLHARWRRGDGGEQISFPVNTPPQEIQPFDTLVEAYAEWQAAIEGWDDSYRDTHCWVLTPANFALILFDLQTLGLVSLTIKNCTLCGGEFIVHLEKAPQLLPQRSSPERQRVRRELLLAALAEAGLPATAEPRAAAAARLKRFVAGMLQLRHIFLSRRPEKGARR